MGGLVGRSSQFESTESREEARGILDVESVGGTQLNMASHIQERMAYWLLPE